MTRAAIIALGLAAFAAPADAACRLALALALDVSRSVDAADYAVQRDGLLAALADPEVRRAVFQPPDHVAIAVYEWSGRGHQEMVVGWTELYSEADLDRVAAEVAGFAGGGYRLPTAIGYALDFGRELFEGAPGCAAHTLDVSGDGRNNDGMSPADAYRREDFGDLVVNALAIGGHEADIVIYYRSQVVRGPGAFVEVARVHTEFPRAIKRKLLRELGDPVLGALDGGNRGG